MKAIHFSLKKINLQKTGEKAWWHRYYRLLDVDPRRDDDASPMSSYRCMLKPT